jgi:hypothetical protein
MDKDHLYSDLEQLRIELHETIDRHPDLTVYETLGVLRVIEADMIERLERYHAENDPEP